MIGSGIFMMPAVLAPYGGISFGAWLLTAAGSIAIALVIGRLASRTTQNGGIPVYTRDTFGDLTGFLTSWVYYAGCPISTAALAVAFVGYLNVLVPGLATHTGWQIAVALAVIWTLTLVSIRGVKDAGFIQLLLTVLKLVPLALIIGLGVVAGKAENLPPVNPTGGNPLAVLSATAMLTMFAFLGLEYGAVPAGNVKNPRTTMPRAVVIGTITVALIYIAATAAVMLLVSRDELIHSTSPMADAAKRLGAWGPIVITVGALISVAGSMNGNIFVTGQIPMAAAVDGLIPAVFARMNKASAPWVSLVFGSVIASVLLLANYSRGLVSAFTFLLLMTTLATLAPYLICALAELRHSWRSARNWAIVALVAAVYATFTILGSGAEALLWGAVLTVSGFPVYYLVRQRKTAPALG